MQQFKFPLGIAARDRITGLTGTLTCVSRDIDGHVQYCIQRTSRLDGQMMTEWLAESRIEPQAEIAEGPVDGPVDGAQSSADIGSKAEPAPSKTLRAQYEARPAARPVAVRLDDPDKPPRVFVAGYDLGSLRRLIRVLQEADLDYRRRRAFPDLPPATDDED